MRELNKGTGRVLALLEKLNWNAEKLAQELSVSFVTLERWEDGTRQPSAKFLELEQRVK